MLSNKLYKKLYSWIEYLNFSRCQWLIVFYPFLYKIITFKYCTLLYLNLKENYLNIELRQYSFWWANLIQLNIFFNSQEQI